MRPAREPARIQAEQLRGPLRLSRMGFWHPFLLNNQLHQQTVSRSPRSETAARPLRRVCPRRSRLAAKGPRPPAVGAAGADGPAAAGPSGMDWWSLTRKSLNDAEVASARGAPWGGT
jgi:hypothetical protein